MVCVDRANYFLTTALNGRALVSVQNPLRLNDYNEPRPDIVALKSRSDYYASKPHTPEDTFFVLEVSDTTLRLDMKVKLPLYAATGVSEVWIANLQENVLLVSRDPESKQYRTRLVLRHGDSISPLAFPGIAFRIDDLLG
jgi:Uma2 family endonuclease